MNAEIINRGRGETVLTDARGEARLPERWRMPFALRIRQIGYQFVDTTLTLGDSASTIRVGLQRIAYTLSAFPVSAPSCKEKPDPKAAMLAANALDQLRMAAERYNTFKTLYPFHAKIERRTRTVELQPPQVREGGHAVHWDSATVDRVAEEIASSEDWGERYGPGRIIERRRNRFSARILFLAHLADPRFWERHCFDVDGFHTVADRTTMRLHFAPNRTVYDIDWEGWAILDSATSELRRIDFRLANVRPRDLPQRLEGYTTFTALVPNIVVPESTVAFWWRQTPASDTARQDVLQFLLLKGIAYRGRQPPP